MNCGELSAAVQTIRECALYCLTAERLFAAASLAGRKFGKGFEENSGGRRESTERAQRGQQIMRS